jgi:hypothetical protein
VRRTQDRNSYLALPRYLAEIQVTLLYHSKVRTPDARHHPSRHPSGAAARPTRTALPVLQLVLDTSSAPACEHPTRTPGRRLHNFNALLRRAALGQGLGKDHLDRAAALATSTGRARGGHGRPLQSSGRSSRGGAAASAVAHRPTRRAERASDTLASDAKHARPFQRSAAAAAGPIAAPPDQIHQQGDGTPEDDGDDGSS